MGMDSEKVIKALECRKNADKRCENPCEDTGLCHYATAVRGLDGEIYKPFICDMERICADALAMLKEQEPRVLTLDEAVDGNQCYYVEFRYHLDCGWVKCDFDKMYLNGEVAMLFLRDKTFYQQREHYGKLWRLWNKQPTYEQKMETKWE